MTPWTVAARLLCQWGFSKQEYRRGLPCPPPGPLPSPEINPRSPALQAGSLLTEAPGKPKNTGVGSLSLLRGIFLTQESNWGLPHCGRIPYQLSYRYQLQVCEHPPALEPPSHPLPPVPLGHHGALSCARGPHAVCFPPALRLTQAAHTRRSTSRSSSSPASTQPLCVCASSSVLQVGSYHCSGFRMCFQVVEFNPTLSPYGWNERVSEETVCSLGSWYQG